MYGAEKNICYPLENVLPSYQMLLWRYITDFEQVFAHWYACYKPFSVMYSLKLTLKTIRVLGNINMNTGLFSSKVCLTLFYWTV